MTIIFICRKCKSRNTLAKEQWLAGEVPVCCKVKTVYHSEDRKKVEIMERKV